MDLQTDYIDLMRQASFALGGLEIRPASREVFAGKERDILEPRVMQVLVALARKPGEVVSRDDLIAQCWAGRVVGDDAINRCVGRLRRLSETYGGFALETLPRIGYRLNLVEPVAAFEVPNPAPQPNAAPSPEQSEVLAAKPAWHRILWLALVVFLAIAGGLLVWRFWESRRQPVHTPGNFSIAVLPFTPLYDDPNAQHLGDSIAASVADMLSGYGLEVVSPTQSFQFRGAAKARATQALHADFIIDGEVRRERGTYVVAVRVIAGDSGTTLLAENLDRPVAQEADLPENVAGEIAELEWFVTTGFGRSALWDPRVMAGALRATHLMMTRADATAANDIARHLEEIAPDDPFAYAIHVRTALKLAWDMPEARKAAYLVEARKAAETAIRIDPSYADAYALHAMTMPSFDWAGRERELRRALTIMPRAPIGYTLAIEFLQNAGRFQESVRLAEEAYAANPYLADINVKTVNSRLWSGQTQTATALIQRGSRLFSKGPWFPTKRFEAAAFYGAPGAAEEVLKDPAVRSWLEPADGPQTFSKIATALRSRRAADISVVVQDCLKAESRSGALQRSCLLALNALGRLDDAFRLTDELYPDQRGATPAELDRRWLGGAISTAYLLTPPAAPMRADPRFRALAERIGLLQYWKATRTRPDFCRAEKIAICRF